MEFRLLGPVEVVSDTGEALSLAREKERRLLAILVMNAGRVVPKEKLIFHVRDDNPEGVTEGTFRSYLTHVKQVVDGAGDQARLVTRDGGYELQVPPSCVDERRFSQLRHRADVAARDGNPALAVALLRSAEALWRGTALGDLDGQWASTTRFSLEEDRRSIVLKRIGLQLDLGHHTELLGELRRLRAQHPDDETCAAYEMKALYWCGRKMDALDVYHKVRNCLDDKAALEPGPELAELHQRILHGDLARPEASRKPQPPEHSARMPLRDTAFVGRAEDLQALTATDPETPQVWVISGLSGTGKTRLAVEAASRMAGETLYLDYAAVAKASLGADEALRRLLEMARVQPPPGGRAGLAASWRRELAHRRVTVILDNVPDADAVVSLLPGSGSSRVFITARRRLHGIAGAANLVLDILPEPDAIALFNETAGKRAPGPEAGASAVRWCGRLPSAVIHAAARLRSDGHLPALTGSADSMDTGEANERLQAVLDSSLSALGDGEQRLLRFLGVSPCPSFGAESAAAVAGVPVQAADEMITSLFEHCVVDHAAGDGFKLYDLFRDYAAFRAARDIPGSDRRDAERRLLDHYLREADRADRVLYPYRHHRGRLLPPQRPDPDSIAQSSRWLTAEWRNVLAVAEHAGQHEWQRHCADLAHSIAGFLDLEGHLAEAGDAYGQALRACRDLGDNPRTARALIDLSIACLGSGHQQQALAHAREALALYRTIGDRGGQAVAVDRIGVICHFSGNFLEMRAYEQEARSLFIQAGDLTGEAEALFHYGISCIDLGNIGEGVTNFYASLDIFERSGDRRGELSVLNSVGEVERLQGHYQEALDLYRRALSICHSLGARRKIAPLVQNIGQVYLYKGDPRRALAEFKQALAASREIGDVPWQARAMCDCGDAYLALGNQGKSGKYYRQAASLADQIGDLLVKEKALRGTADTYRESGAPDEALHYYQEALRLAREVPDPHQHALILDGIAETMLRSGDADGWRIHLRQACDLYRDAGAAEDERSARLRLGELDDSGVDEGPFPATSALKDRRSSNLDTFQWHVPCWLCDGCAVGWGRQRVMQSGMAIPCLHGQHGHCDRDDHCEH